MFSKMAGRGLLLVMIAVTGCSNEQQIFPATPAAPATATPSTTTPVQVRDGEALFKQYCAPCHPNGGNVSDPGRSLYGSVLKRKHIATVDDIVRIMRNPLSRMIRFDAATLPDKDAEAIAGYILETFK